MKMSSVAQGFSPFQVMSIRRDFDLKNIQLFSIRSLWNCCFIFYFILYIGCDNKYVSSNLIAYLTNKSYDLYSCFTLTETVYEEMYVHTIRVEQFASNEGDRFGQKFQPLIFEIKVILVLCIIKKICQNNTKIVSWYRDIQGRNWIGRKCPAVELR